MKKGFFSRFHRPGQVETLAPGIVPRAEAAAAAASDVAKVVRRFARKGLPQSGRKTAISLRLDDEVLDWFRAQGVTDIRPFGSLVEDVFFRLPLELRRAATPAA